MSKKPCKDQIRKKRMPLVEPLEPRILFSADILSTAMDSLTLPDHKDQQHDWLTGLNDTVNSQPPSQPDKTTLENEAPYQPTIKPLAAEYCDGEACITQHSNGDIDQSPVNSLLAPAYHYGEVQSGPVAGKQSLANWNNTDSPDTDYEQTWNFSSFTTELQTNANNIQSVAQSTSFDLDSSSAVNTSDNTRNSSGNSQVNWIGSKYQPIADTAAYDFNTNESTASFEYHTSDHSTVINPSKLVLANTYPAVNDVTFNHSSVASNTADVIPDQSTYDQALPLEVIFVDAGVDNPQLLIDGLQSSLHSQTQTLIIELSASHDGIEQITQTLNQLSDVDAIHILSHSVGAGIQLGNGRLALDTATGYTSDISQWRNALSTDADLLIYGCDLASSEDGRELMRFISAVSDSDVAASDDPTGHIDLGGDWDLEYTQGDVTTEVPFNSAAQNSWQETLAAASSGIELNTNGGNDAYLYTTNAGAILGGVSAFTLEFQFTVESINFENTLFAYAVDGQTNELFVLIQNSGNIAISIDNTVHVTTNSYLELLDGGKHSLALSWDQSSGQLTFFVDGVLTESIAGFINHAVIDPGGTLVLGQEQDAVGGGFVTTQTFSGTLHDVRIWDEVRSENEISLNHQQKFNPAALPAGLVANWQMDAINSLGEVTDVVNGNNLSIGHATEAGFTISTPVEDLHIPENASAGDSVGIVIAGDQSANNDIVSDGLFTEAADPATFQTYSTGQTIGDWLVVSGDDVALHNADGVFQDETPFGGNAIHLSNGTNDGIEQTLVTEVGKQYQITFEATGYWDTAGTKVMRVSADSTTSDFTYDVAPPNWDLETGIVWEPGALQFTATSTATTLTFETIGGIASRGVLLADVQVTEVPDAVTTILTNDTSLTYDAATGKFYRLVNSAVNFQTAIDAAIAATINGVSGQLVTIHSAHENSIVQNLAQSIAQNVWVGGSDRTTETDWYWLNQNDDDEFLFREGSGPSAGTYVNWVAGGPINTDDGMRMRHDVGEWNPTNVNESHEYIIEWDANAVLSGFTYAISDSSGNFEIDPTTGEITVAAANTLNYEANPSHSITVTVTDAAGTDNSASMTVLVDAVNEAPAFINLDDSPAFTNDTTPVILDSDVQITDPELSSADNFSGAVLTLQRNSAASSDDEFSASGLLGALTESANLSYNGTTLGTVTTNSSGILALTFDGNATNALVNSVMQSIAYRNNNGNPPASTQIDWTFNDANSANAQGSGGALSASGTITVTAANDPPTNTMPGAQTTGVDAPLTLSGGHAIQIWDLDADNNPVQVTLTADNGTLSLATTTGLTFTTGDGTNDPTITATATIADLNAALDGLVFNPAPSFEGTATINMLTDDMGNTGSGGSQSDNDALSILVGGLSFQQDINGYTGTSDTHVYSGSSSTSFGNETRIQIDDTTQDGLIRFDNIFGSGAGLIPYGATITNASLSVYVTSTDPADNVQVHRMLAPWSETSTWNSLTGGISANNVEAGSAVLHNIDAGQSGWKTITGITSTVQAWSDGADNEGLAFLSTDADGWAIYSSEFSNTSLRPYLNIGFNAPQPAAIDLDSNNDSGASGGAFNTAFIEGGGAVLIADDDAAIVDADSTQLTSMTVTISNQQDDVLETLSANTSGTLITASYVSATGTLTLSGTDSTANYQQVLRTVSYENTSEDPDTTTRTITVQATDPFLSSNIAIASVVMTAINDDPGNSGSLPSDVTATEDVQGNIDLSLIDLADADAGSATLPVTLTTTGGGTLAATSSGGVVVAGSGTGILSLTGSLTNLNTFLNQASNIRFTGAPDANGNDADSIQVSVSDSGNTGNGGGGTINLGTVNVDINAVNDQPVLATTGSPQLVNVFQNSGNPDGNLVSEIIASAGGDPITDVDAGSLEGIAVTGVDDTNGVWQFSTNGGTTWINFGSVSDTTVVVLTDTAGDRIRFVPDLEYTGNSTFTYRAWDRSDASSSGDVAFTNTSPTAFSTPTESVSVTVEPTEVLLWLSTAGDVGPANSQPPSDVPGLDSWSAGTVIGVSNPDLSFGSASTSGTFGSVIDFDSFDTDSDVNLNGLQYVTSDITLTGAGIQGGSVDLLAGDMIFLTASAKALTSSSTGAPAGWASNITTTTDAVYIYRAETPGDYSSGYFRQLLFSLSSADTVSIALVETTTTIAGTTLDAGDFLFVRSGNTLKNDIMWYDTSADNWVTLIAGADIGMGNGASGTAITGLDLIETSITTGGITLNAGNILVSIDQPTTIDGLAVQPQDIIVLDVTSTSIAGGTSAATARFLLDGDDYVNLDTASESLDALTLIARGTGGNQAPVLSNTPTPFNFTEDSTPVIIDGTLVVSDTDNSNFDGGTLRVDITSGGERGDRLSVFNQGTGSGQIGISGNDVTFAGIAIGKMTGGLNSASPLVIHLNASADITAVQSLIRNTTYWNTSDNPASSTRTIAFTMTDGLGGSSNTVSQSATVTTTPDSPRAIDDTAALDFDGDDYVLIADSPSLIMTNTVTLEAWIKPQSPIATSQIIVNKEGEYEVALFGDGTIRWAFDNTDPDWSWHSTGYQVSSAEWTHIAISYDNGTVSSYANGRLIDVYYGSGPIGDSHPVENTLRIGGREALEQYFDGQIDDVRIWNTARTQTEIVTNLDVALTGSETGLAGYWNLNEGQGSTTSDLSANANHGTLTNDSATGAPVWTGYSTDQNTQLSITALNGVISNDRDGDGDTLNVTAVNGSGINVGSLFTLPSGATLSVNATGAFTYDLGTAFDYLTTGAVATDSFSYEISDGNGTNDNATVTINITGINDAPQATGLNTAETYIEDQPLNLADIIVSDADDTDVTATLSLSDVAAGTLSTASSGLVTSTFSGGLWTAAGNIADVNTLLAGLTFTPTSNYAASFSITTSIDDGEATPVNGVKQFSATAINNAPVVTAPTSALAATEQTGLAIHGTGFSVSDVDEAGSGATATIAVSEGQITVNSGDSATVVSAGNGSNAVTVTGSVAQINNLLTGVGSGTITYLNNNDSPAPTTTINVTVNDNGNTGSDPGLSGGVNDEQHTASQIINITMINDDPTNTGSLPVSITVTEDVSSDFDLSAVNLVDTDANGNLTVTLTTSTGGNLTAGSASGIAVSGNGTTTLGLTGTQADLNAFLNTASNIQYLHPTLQINGVNADSVSVYVSDNGNTGNGGGGAINLGDINVDINAVNDNPVNTGSLPANIVVTEDVPGNIDLSQIILSDIDASNSDLTITLTTAAGGTLTANTGGGVTITGSGSGLLSLTGNQSNLNTFLNTAANIQFTGALNANGINTDTIQVDATDNGNTGTGGGGTINFGIINIDIIAVNDNPTNAGSLPANITVTEDVTGNVDLSAIDLSDVDSANDNLTVTLTSNSGGTLAGISNAGVAVTSSGSGVLTLTGSQNNLNAWLNLASSVQFTGALNSNGSAADSIRVDVTDNGNTGSAGGGTITLGNVNVNINAVNDNPINTGSVPSDIIVTEDIASDLDLSLINLFDIDSVNDNLTVTLTSSAAGTLTAKTGGGITVSGSGTTTLSLTGNQSALNAFLNLPSGVRYTGTLNNNGDDADTIQVDVTDNGNTGSGGGNAISVGSINIDITAVNDDPANPGGLPSDVVVVEDIASSVDVSQIILSDVDSAAGNLTITLATSAGGSLTATDSGGVTVVGSGSGSLLLTGNQSDLNAFLNQPLNILYTGALNANGNDADNIQVDVTDNGNTGTGGSGLIDLGSFNIDINPVNDNPINAGSLVTDIALTEDIAGNVDLSLIDLSDVDSGTASLTITLATNTGGTLSAAAAAGVTITGNNSGLLSLAGNQTDLNTFLDLPSNLQYTGALNTHGNDSDIIQISVIDNGSTGSGGGNPIDFGSVNIDLGAVNDDPVNTGGLPSDIVVVEDIASNIDLSLIDLIDVDSATGSLTITLATGAGGTLAATSGDGVTVTGSGTNLMTLTGNQSDLNTLLNAATGILFTSAPNANGNDSDSIMVDVTDNGNTGNGGGASIILGTVNIDTNALNDDPVNAGSLPTDIITTEDVSTNIDLSLIDLVDADSASGNLTITLTTSAGGILTAFAGSGVAVTGSGSGLLSLTGNQSDLNTFLNLPSGIQFTSALNANGDNADSIQVDVSDNGNTGSGGGGTINFGTVNVDIIAINDAPVITTVGPQSLNEEIQTLIPGISIADHDVGTGNITTRLQVSSGVMQVALTGSATIISGANDSGDLTIEGNLTDINSTLASLRYTGNTDVSGNAADTLIITTRDGGNTGSGGALQDTGNVQIDIAAINDAPHNNLPGTQTIDEETLTAINGISIVDVDAGLANITTRLQVANGVLLVSLSGNATITAGDSGGNDLTIQGSVVDVNATLASLSYRGNADITGTAADTLQVTTDDGGNSGNGGALQDIGYVQIDIAPLNDAPVLSAIESVAHSYTENDGATAITAALTVGDVDDSDLLHAQVQITGNYQPNEDVLAFTDSGNITGSWDTNTATLTLSGSDSIASYQAALRSVTYQNTSENPIEATRSASFTVNDGDINSQPQTHDIIVTRVNDAPSGSDYTVTAVEDTTYTFSIEEFGFSDISDNHNFDSVFITTLPANGILTLSGVEVSAGQLVSVTSISAGLLGFEPSDNRNGTAYDEFSFQVVDNGGRLHGGNDRDATANTITIDVISVNDAPTGNDSTATGLEDFDYTLQVSDFGYTDALDGNTFESVTIDSLPVRGQLNHNGQAVEVGQIISTNLIAAGQLVFSPLPDTNGSSYDQLGFRVTDDGGLLNGGSNTSAQTNTLQFDISAVNDPPQGGDSTIVTTEDTAHIFQQTDFVFTDSADGNRFSAITVSALPESGSITMAGQAVQIGDVVQVSDIDAGLLRYTPALNAEGNGYNGLGFQVHDDGGTTNGGVAIDLTSNFISFDIPAVNDPPALISQLTTVDEGSDTTLTDEMLTGVDADDLLPEELTITLGTAPLNGSLTLSGTLLTAGDTFSLADIAEHRVHYIHDGSETSSDFFEVSLTDGGEDGAQAATGRFSLIISEVIDPPPVLSGDSLFLQFGETFDSTTGDLLDSGFSDLYTSNQLNNTQHQITIETQPLHGSIELMPDGRFSYIHNGSGVLQDQFSYRVTNEDGVFTLATVHISIEPPLSTAFGSVAASLISPAPETTQEEPEPETESEIEENTETSIDFRLPPQPKAMSHQQALAVDEQSTIKFDTAAEGFNERYYFDVIKHNAIRNPTVEYQPLEVTTTNFDVVFEVRAKRALEVVQNPSFLDALNRLESDLAEADSKAQKNIKLLEDTVLGVSISAVAGVLSWALRGGALFASLVAATPLWSSLDPTKVLGVAKTNEKDNPVEDEAVENLFEK